MEWEFCRFDILNDLSGQGMEQDVFVDISDIPGNYSNPFNILYKTSDIINNSNIGLDIIKDFSENFKNKLDLEVQDADDIYFYTGMIQDSYDFHKQSFKVKQIKLEFDLNSLLSNHLYEKKGNVMKIITLDKKTCTLFEESFKKVKAITEEESRKKTKPLWIKDNHLEQLENLTNDMVRIFKYHYEINLFYMESILREIQFYNINV